ncbi:MAG: hypothetical protein OXC62_12810 [Aestuariivita sp.]|nr:hypothetical protein [Aestuariivita sp.]
MTLWKRIKPLFSGKETGLGKPVDNRQLLKAVLWQDILAPFGNGTVSSDGFARSYRKIFLSVWSDFDLSVDGPIM